MSKVVSVIPAKPMQVIRGLDIAAKKRVCAYCRVSTDTEEQLSSYETQVSYYEDYIKKRPDWEFSGIYADEGITGTNTKKRTDFHRMIDDCLAGKIDMIITKSISRFARNTLDCLQYVRMLKDKGIGVYFEKENIDTLDAKGEVLLTILSSLAQDESRSISENSRWGITRRFQQGKVRVNHTKFMGFDKDENGELIINEPEAAHLRRIVDEYLNGGKGLKKIKKGLEADGILTATGNKVWHESAIKKMLQNEKLAGDALLQKTITVDFLTHKRVKNEGQVPQYFVENSHPAIISKETFQAVQREMERRSQLRKDKDPSRYTNRYPFSGKIVCSECGKKFTRKHWGAGKYKKPIWICRTRIEDGKKGCSMPTLDEEKLQEVFVRVVNRLLTDKDTLLSDMLENIEKVFRKQTSVVDLAAIDGELKELQGELAALVKLNLKTGIDDTIYGEEYNRIASRMEELKSNRSSVTVAEFVRQETLARMREITEVLRSMDTIGEFDEELFGMLVERIKVINLVQVEFVLHSGVGIVETV
jgi:DNA invertase Pin-like site-specific DNA recombinase